MDHLGFNHQSLDPNPRQPISSCIGLFLQLVIQRQNGERCDMIGRCESADCPERIPFVSSVAHLGRQRLLGSCRAAPGSQSRTERQGLRWVGAAPRRRLLGTGENYGAERGGPSHLSHLICSSVCSVLCMCQSCLPDPAGGAAGRSRRRPERKVLAG